MMDTYGYEMILDLHGCDLKTFNEKSIGDYFDALCDAIQMEQCKRHFWRDSGIPREKRKLPHIKGVSAVQFITTSSIVVHALELLEAVYVNIFSCKRFDSKLASKITVDWFGATTYGAHVIERI